MDCAPTQSCSCLCHTIGGVTHAAACCLPEPVAPEGPVVHGFVSLSRQGRKVLATTGCGEQIKGEPSGGLISIGITPWASLTTCPPCLERIGLKEPTS
jgi:hypothetical protein